MKMYQHRSYVVALENAADVHGMYVDENRKGLSFRNYKDYLLLGGGAHRTGKQGGGFAEVRETAKRLFPESKEITGWATQDCMTLDGIPYIGQYSKNMPGVYVATGFNKWGMTSSMVAAMVLSDLVLERENEFQELYLPSRSSWHPQLAVNLGETLGHFILPIPKRCSHLGCALMWNEQEHTWDCACHGSRYEENGKLINNPATKDAKIH